MAYAFLTTSESPLAVIRQWEASVEVSVLMHGALRKLIL